MNQMKLTRKMVLISIILLAAYATPVSAEVGDLLMSTGYKSLDVGESWNLEEGYVITIKQIDKEGNKIWLVLSKYNSQVDSEVLSSGETYIYEKEIGSKEYTILQANVGEIDKESRTVRFDSVRQYSDGGVADIASPLPVIANFKNETYSSGTAIVHGTWLFDLDTGGEVGHSERNAADFWWEQATKEIRYLVPQNGAKLANMGIVDINSVDCSHARYSESKIAGSINNNKIPVGTVICVKTNLGNYAKFRIDEYGYDLEISWVCQAVQTSATTASSTVKLISPLNGVVMDNGRTDRQDSVVWDFDWSDAKSANRYQLYVKGSGAEIPIIDTITTSSSYHYVGSGSYIVDRNRYGWTWKVRAQVNGRWGGWSETRNFQVEKVNTDQHSQTVTQPTSASTSARTPATTRHAIPVATFANSTSQHPTFGELK